VKRRQTLFVTVLANFFRCAVLPFSQSKSVYISSILAPTCCLVRGASRFCLLSSSVNSRFGPTCVGVERLEIVACLGIGVRDAETAGLCRAYVTNRASDRNTSALRLHLTREVKASKKLGNTSGKKASPFRASRNRLTMPKGLLDTSLPYLRWILTHAK
jgi:hypothetical protein